MFWRDWIDEITTLNNNEVYTRSLTFTNLGNKVNIKYALESDKPIEVHLFVNEENKDRFLAGNNATQYPICSSTSTKRFKCFAPQADSNSVLLIKNNNQESIDIKIKAEFNTIVPQNN